MLLMVDTKQARWVYGAISMYPNFKHIGFSNWGLLFAIFKKYPVPSLLAKVSHNEAKMRGEWETSASRDW